MPHHELSQTAASKSGHKRLVLEPDRVTMILVRVLPDRDRDSFDSLAHVELAHRISPDLSFESPAPRPSSQDMKIESRRRRAE